MIEKEKKAENLMRGKTVAIVGGGPAGSFAAYLLAREGIKVDIYEPRSARQPDLAMGERIHPCTGCAGLLHTNAVKLLEKHGIVLPESLVQVRLEGAETYFPFSSESVHLSSLKEAVTIFRGFSPQRQGEKPVESFDAYLLNKAVEAGAIHHQKAVEEIDLTSRDQKVHLISADDKTHEADMVIGAFGHHPNLAISIKYPESETPLPFPVTQRAGVREYYFGREKVKELLKENIHVFGNPTERIWFAAIVPKGNYISVVIMGREKDIEVSDFADFIEIPQVQALTKGQLIECPISCACLTRCLITLKSPERFIARRDNRVMMVNIGDAGATTPRRNGMFAALDNAQHLVEALAQKGNDPRGLEDYRRYIERRYVWDNRWSEVVLKISDLVLNNKLPRQAIVYLAKKRLPVISQAVGNTMTHILTGKDAYWKIPLNVILDTLRNPLK